MTKNIAVEEEMIGSQIETEIAFYAKIGNFDGLDQAERKEHQIQMGSLFQKEGCKSRVRSVLVLGEENDKPNYYFTIKSKRENENADVSLEHTTEVNEEFFVGFKDVADNYMDKIRYIFRSSGVQLQTEDQEPTELPEVLYEVDVYKKPDGEFSQWCKIDVELNDIINHLKEHHSNLNELNLTIRLKHLPFEPQDIIIGSGNDEETKSFVKKLWDEEFLHSLG